jgi:hypothetical protein
MSGVLDRMVKRAHGRLPAVQPLMVSAPAEAAGPVESMEEPGPRSGQQMASETTLPRTAMLTDHDAHRREGPLQNLVANFHRVPLNHTLSRPETMRQIEPVDAFARRSESGLTAFQLDKTGNARRPSNPKGSERKPSADDREVLPRETKPDLRKKPFIVDAEQNQGLSIRAESVPTVHSEPAEQRTEIHISIGSIELRAPRTEARPKSAPFRPRISLDEFLRCKPGNQP